MKDVTESSDITPASAPRAELRRKAHLSWLALSCSLLLTFLAWDVASRSVSGRMRDQFLQRSEQIALAITRRMQEHEALLRGGVALFVASHDVRRQEFHDFFLHQDLARHYPGIEGISENERRNAMERAWRTDLPTASAIVRLVQDTEQDHQPGFLLYLPVFRGDHTTEAQRRASLIGFVFSPLRTRDLMRGILGQGPTDIDYAVRDERRSAPFFDTRAAPSSYEPNALQRQRPLAIAGRTWTLQLWARPNFGNWVSRWEPSAVLATGLVINLLLFYILAGHASLQSRAQHLANQMTEELTQSHVREQAQMLNSLREKETLLKEIHHRVKNNLQVVSSLLSLQRNHTQDDRAIEPLRQSQMRVLAMAALHEFLYQSRDLSRVDTKAYRAGKLKVLFRRREDSLVLCIEDDGPGLADDVDLAAPSTLGLSLVQLLSQQLGGTLNVSRAPLSRFTITFPFSVAGPA